MAAAGLTLITITGSFGQHLDAILFDLSNRSGQRGRAQ
jgi:hypothetical protein